MTRREALFGFAILLLIPILGHAASPYKAVQQGNELYQAGQYEEAARQYAIANQILPEAAEIHFNRGNVFYKQKSYAKALEHYTSALHTVDRALESQVKYNLGNVEYQRALLGIRSLPDALIYIRSAITYYRDSLEIDPQQQAARYNLELAHRLRKLLAKKQQEEMEAAQEGRSGSEHEENQRQNNQQRSQQQDQSQNAEQQAQDQQASQPTEDDAASDTAAVPTDEMATEEEEELSQEEAERELESIRQRARSIAEAREQWQRARLRQSREGRYW